jgi:hypothetical protein
MDGQLAARCLPFHTRNAPMVHGLSFTVEFSIAA